MEFDAKTLLIIILIGIILYFLLTVEDDDDDDNEKEKVATESVVVVPSYWGWNRGWNWGGWRRPFFRRRRPMWMPRYAGRRARPYGRRGGRGGRGRRPRP